MQVNKVRGYSLFNEVEDVDLQSKNRVVTLANILEDNLYEDGKVTQGGMQYSMEYYEQISKEDRVLVYSGLQVELKKRGMLSE